MGLSTQSNWVQNIKVTGVVGSTLQEAVLGRFDGILSVKEFYQSFFNKSFLRPGQNWSVVNGAEVLKAMQGTLFIA